MIVLRWVRNWPRNIVQQLQGSCTWPRIDWIWEWRQLSSPKPWQFQEKVTMNVPNALRDTFMAILITCNGTHFRKKPTKSFWILPHVAKHVVQIQGGTVMLGNHLIAAWSQVQPRIALSSGEAELYHSRQNQFERFRVFFGIN